MTRAALRKNLAAALPLLGIVAVLIGLFVLSERTSERPPSPFARAIVAVPAPLPSRIASPARPLATRVSPTTGRAEMQVCGGTWIGVDENGVVESEPLLAMQERLARETEPGVLASMAASGEPRTVATGLQLRWLMSGRGPDPAGREAFETLVGMATVTRDPEVYGTAYETCVDARAKAVDTAVPPARCALLTTAQWTALDAGNAFPWLVRAEEAHRRGEPTEEDDALWQASQAPLFESLWAPSIGRVMAHVPDGDGERLWGALGVAVGTVGLYASQSTSVFRVLRSCATAALVDARRRDTCERLATRVTAIADTLIWRSVGGAMGRNVGWSDETLAAVATDTRAYMEAFGSLEAAVAPEDCGAVRRDVERFREVGRLGEIGMVRRALAARAGASAVPLR